MGLAGPWAGLSVSAVLWAYSRMGGGPLSASLAQTNAWINLVNLLPLGSLDGGRAVGSLAAWQRFLLLAVAAGLWMATREGLTALVAIVLFLRVLGPDSPKRGNGSILLQYMGLTAAAAFLGRHP